MDKKEQTSSSFRDKWQYNQNLLFSETLREGSDVFNWILNRNGFSNPESFRNWLSDKKRILDAGCGNGRVTALLRQYAPPATSITGIDLVSVDIARKNLSNLKEVYVHKKDLLEDLTDLGKYDLIYCQEVLHHTTDPRRAFLNLCQCLTEKGEIAIYVYKKKAPLREFADDYIRDLVSNLPYEKAMDVMRSITKLGKSLAELDLKVIVPDIDLLEIESGEYDLQRFFYHFFLKCFWNPSFSFEENAAINYDWYHPQISFRHTLAEVESWFQQAGFQIIHRHVDYYGITLRGRK